MIEIIESYEYIEPKYRFSCSKCHSVAEITEDEVKEVGNYWDYYYEFKCPICGKSYTANNSHKVLRRKEFKNLGE